MIVNLPSKGSVLIVLITLHLFFVSCKSTKELYHTIDVVQAKSNYEAAVMYFYENNWKVFRERAYREKQIQGYHLLKSPEDSLGMFSLVLITAYDSVQLAENEENFQKIIQEMRPEGPALLNNQPIREMIRLVQSFDTKNIASD